MNTIETFDFYGQQITLLDQEGEQYALLGQLCSHMELHVQGQQESLSRQVWAQGMTRVTRVQLLGDAQARSRYLINVKIVGMWLANITSSRIADPHTREMVERYQIELTQKIHEWLTKPAPAPVELDRRTLALMVIEAEDARVAAVERAVVAEARAESTQKILDNVEIKDGLVVRDWIGRYFLPRQENRIWGLFYAKSLLKDGRGKGGTDRDGKPKSSRDHQRVYTDGFPFFIRAKKEFQVGDGVTRYETRVRPGRAELELVSYCEKHGIMPLPEVSQALKEISEISDVAGPLRAVAA